MIERAERSMERGDFDAAIAAYAEAVEATPWNTRVVRALAAAHVARGARWRVEGSLPAAETDLRRAQELQPDDPAIRRDLAVVLIERADRDMDEARAARLRAEAVALAPDLADSSPVNALLERQLELAFELIERGQLEAGVARLEWLSFDYPDEPRVRRLQAQAEVGLGSRLYERRNFAGAAEHYGRAVELYSGCSARVCAREEVTLAHQNRIVALVESSQPREARAALERAEARGMRFPELRAVLPRSESR